MKMRIPWLVALVVCGTWRIADGGDAGVPLPQFQGDFFGEMGRDFATIVAVDVQSQKVTVELDRDGSRVIVPVRSDTEIHFRDSWGELGDYFPGEHVMLFMYVDDERKWTYPRAIQDDLHVAARHGWFAKVTAIDTAAKTYATVREEKDGQGKVVKEITGEYGYSPGVKVWKGRVPGAIDTLILGDEVIQQLVRIDGRKVAVEIVDRAGDKEIAAEQDAKHHADEDRLGLPCYVTDVDVLTGGLSVTVAWCSAARAKSLKPGQAVALQPGDGSKVFAASLCDIQAIDTRARLNLVVNSRVASRLGYGQVLRLFMPGTGPELPTGRTGVPVFTKK
jgi:hypothetical protein